MARRPKPKPDDPEQSKLFIKASREVGADETGEAFERVFKKVAGRRVTAAQRSKRQASHK